MVEWDRQCRNSVQVESQSQTSNFGERKSRQRLEPLWRPGCRLLANCRDSGPSDKDENTCVDQPLHSLG